MISRALALKSNAGVAGLARASRARGRRFAIAILLLRFVCCLRAATGRAQATRKAQEQDLLLQSDGRARMPLRAAALSFTFPLDLYLLTLSLPFAFTFILSFYL